MEEFEKGFEIEMDVIELDMEDGSTVECGVQDQFEMDDHEYIVLSPIGEDNFLSDDVVYYFRVEYEGEDMVLEDIEDEEELKNVKAAYDDLINPAYDNTDDSEEE